MKLRLRIKVPKILREKRSGDGKSRRDARPRFAAGEFRKEPSAGTRAFSPSEKPST